MAEVSIIVPVYNVEQYLKKCVDSILSQTFTDFELILVDDGSVDSSGIICDDYAKEYPSVRVIHQENRGQAHARNTGIKNADSEWIMFVDSDDVIHPQMLELLYKSAKQSHTQISACFRDETNEIPEVFEPVAFSEEVFPVNEEYLLHLLEEKNEYSTIFWVVYAKLIKKSIIEECLFTAGKIYEDNAIACKWLIKAGVISIVPAYMYIYRNNPTGTMNQTLSCKKLDYLWAIEQLTGFCESVGYNKLLSRLANEYAHTALWLKKRFVEENDDVTTAIIIDRLISSFYGRYRKNVQFDSKIKSDIFRIRYPFLQRVKKIVEHLSN